MSVKTLVYGGLVYVVLAIVLGMLGGMLAPYAILIAALIAGIFLGRKSAGTMKGVFNGLIGGAIGGIIISIIAPFVPTTATGTTGVLMLDSAISSIFGILTGYLPMLASFGFTLAAGIILGAIGGFIGTKLKR